MGQEVQDRTHLPSHPTSSSAARDFVGDTLHRWQLDHLVDVARLLTAELVTNALCHTGSEVDVVVRDRGERVRVEVHDASPKPALRLVTDADAEAGRGLVLVEGLAASWGVEHLGNEGKAVWFEVLRYPSPAVGS